MHMLANYKYINNCYMILSNLMCGKSCDQNGMIRVQAKYYFEVRRHCVFIKSPSQEIAMFSVLWFSTITAPVGIGNNKYSYNLRTRMGGNSVLGSICILCRPRSYENSVLTYSMDLGIRETLFLHALWKYELGKLSSCILSGFRSSINLVLHILWN